MTQTIQHNYEQLLDEAASWIARLRSSDVSSRDHQAFSQWLNRSQKHSQAFDEMADTWETLGAAAHIESLTQELNQRTSAASSASTETQSWNWLSWNSGFAMACVAALFAFVTLLLPEATVEQQIYATGPGEQRTLSLKDGSVVELNTRTELKVSFSDEQRNLTLVSGEAFFQVAPNKSRPFVVDVGQGSVMAVGTAFNIRRHSQNAEVVVTEGIVQMSEHQDPSTPAPKSERLVLDQKASFGKRGLSKVSHADAESSLAWRSQTLIFEQVTLVDALEELNRYLDQPVDTSDASLKGLEVSGTFSVKAPEATLQAFKASFNLAEQANNPQRLYLPAE